MKHIQSEEAVSPAISVILMIAVVVVLAAIVGTVAFGSVGTQGNSKAVALTANKGTSGIVFTVQGGADLPSVTALDLVSGSSITNCTSPGESPKIGASCTGGTDSNGRTVMVATFADGSKQVVFDKNWGSRIGGNYGTGSMSKINLTSYHITITSGPDSDQIHSWYLIVTVNSTGQVQTGTATSGAPWPIDSDVTEYPDWSRVQLILNINGGGTATLFDQTF